MTGWRWMVSQMCDKYDKKNAGSDKQNFEADCVISYFKMEWRVLLAVTVSGLIYNLGLLAFFLSYLSHI